MANGIIDTKVTTIRLLKYAFWDTRVIVLAEVSYWRVGDKGGILEVTHFGTAVIEMSKLVLSVNPLS